MTIHKNKTILRFTHGLLLIALLLSAPNAFSQKKTKLPKEEVTEPVKKLSATEQRKYDYYFLEGVRLREKEEYDAAFEMYKHCLSIDPDAPSALFEISWFYINLRQPEKAEESLLKAVKGDPKNAWYQQTLASFYQAKGDYKKAINIYENIVCQFPADEDSFSVLLALYSRAKEYGNVIKTLDKLEELTGKSEQLGMERFQFYQAKGNKKQALKEIEKLSKEYPNDVKYPIIMGDFYMDNNENQKARDMYQKALEQDPDNILAMLSIATYYDKTGQKDLYNQQLDSVLLNNRVDSNTKIMIMQRLMMQSGSADRDSVKISSLFKTMMEQQQDDAQVPMLYAQYLLLKKQEKEAIPVLKKVLDIDPENIAARLMVLRYALKNEDTDEVIRICEPALQYSPETQEFYFYLGIAYYQKDKKDDALAVFKKGIEQTTSDSDKDIVSEFYSVMGNIYFEKKMRDEAYAAYDSSLVYNPNNIGTLNDYAYYLSLERRDLDRAEEMSYKTIKASSPAGESLLDTYAWILFEKGKYMEAKIYIDDAMKNGGDTSDVIVEHCGDIYYMNGEKEEALKYWQKALELGSQSKTLKKKIELKKYIAE